MTNEQLYLALGIPVLFNAAMTTFFTAYVNCRLFDTRLKHLEER